MGERDTTPAKNRILDLLDPGTFVEIGAGITAKDGTWSRETAGAPSDGVITGYGLIDSRPVYVYSQDASVLGGSMSTMHAEKILRLYATAQKTGDPVIGLLDSTGLRLEEGLSGLEAFGKLLTAQNAASGLIPQITAVFGTCGGGASILPALSDFTFMEADKGRLFYQSPNTLPGNAEDVLDTSSAEFRTSTAGSVDFSGTESEILAEMRRLIRFLPSNCDDRLDPREAMNDINAVYPELEAFRDDPISMLLQLCGPDGVWECRRSYAPEMRTALIEIGGFVAGVVANGISEEMSGSDIANGKNMTMRGTKKAAAFVRFCDAFSIPVLSFVNTGGFISSVEDESGLPESAAALASAFTGSSVPKICLVTGKAIGSAYLIMNSRALGADLVYAWQNAEISAIDAVSAARILTDTSDKAALREAEETYRAEHAGLAEAVACGIVDTVIDPQETGKYLIGALDMLFTKSDGPVEKKHASRG